MAGTAMFTRGIGAPQPRRHAADAVSIISCARLALPLLLDVRAKRELAPQEQDRNKELTSGEETTLRQGERNILAGE